MVFYTCPKCNKIFTKKSHFLNHVELKRNHAELQMKKSSSKILKLPQKSSKNPHFY